jgi:hypothetical protein
MAVLTFTIGANDEQRVLDGFAKAYGAPPGSDPETWVPDWLFVMEHISDYIKKTTLAVEANDAAEIARADALTDSIDIDLE